MHDLRDAVRALLRTPLVTAIAVLSLALGIGANTAMFSIVDALVLRALPVPGADRLASLGDQSWQNPVWEQIRDRPALFDGAFAWSSARFDLAAGGETRYAQGLYASGGFWDVLGVRAALGRTFGPADDRRDGGPDGPVAVLSHAYWQRAHGGDPGVIGRTVTLDRVAYTIVGIAPAGFFGPEVGRTFDVAVPLGTEALVRGPQSMLDRRSAWWLQVVVRRREGQSLEQAQAALRGIQPQVREATMPEHYRPQDRASYLSDPFTLVPAATGSSELRQQYRRPLFTLLAVVGLVLLIACGNIANLQLARATARRHELSVRSALGATRARLGRQLLVESLLLAAAGAVLGTAVAALGGRLLVRMLSTSSRPVHLELPLDWRILGFTTAAAGLTALLFGTLPALRAARAQPIDAMKEHGRGTTSERRAGLAGGLVVAQVALSLVLLVGAGLFVRTFASLATLRLGFDQSGLLVANVGAQRTGADSAARRQLYERLREAALAQPGVRGAALSSLTPVGNARWNDVARVEGMPPLPEMEAVVWHNAVGPEWFATYRTPLVRGRDFGPGDVAGAPRVAIVNQAFVRRYLGGADPVGRVLLGMERGDEPTPRAEIVGVVGDAVYSSLRDSVPPTVYLSFAQEARVPMSASLTVRVAGDPALATRRLTSALVAVDPQLAVTYRTLADQVDAALLQERLVAALSAFFGTLAMLLAGIGLYGVAAYSVSRRRVEMGIRMALGTTPAGVVRLVLSRVAGQVALGVVLGVAISWWAARFVASLLYGLGPTDPPTIAVAVLLLGAVGGVAAWLPARRASRIDPAIVLRDG